MCCSYYRVIAVLWKSTQVLPSTTRIFTKTKENMNISFWLLILLLLEHCCPDQPQLRRCLTCWVLIAPQSISLHFCIKRLLILSFLSSENQIIWAPTGQWAAKWKQDCFQFFLSNEKLSIFFPNPRKRCQKYCFQSQRPKQRFSDGVAPFEPWGGDHQESEPGEETDYKGFSAFSNFMYWYKGSIGSNCQCQTLFA